MLQTDSEKGGLTMRKSGNWATMCLYGMICLMISCFFVSYATAQDKVVVIPLDSNSSLSQLDWININPFSAYLDNGANFHLGYSGGIHLPNSGNPNFDVGFTVPPNYKPGTRFILYVL